MQQDIGVTQVTLEKRVAGETDLSVGSNRTFTPIAAVEGRTGGRGKGQARKDRLGNRLRHAENYADAVIPDNSAAVLRARVIVKVACRMPVAQFYGKTEHLASTHASTFSSHWPDDPFFRRSF